MQKLLHREIQYIFLIIFALETMLFPAVLTPEENTFHNNNPEKTKTG